MKISLLCFAVVTAGLLFAGCLPYSSPLKTHGLDTPKFDTLKPMKVDIARYEQDYKGYDGVYLFVDQTFDMYASRSMWTGITPHMATMRHTRYVVLNPDKEYLTTLDLTMDSDEQLLSAFSIVYSPDGTVQTFTDKDMAVTKTEDGTRYRIAYPNVKKGTIIEEGWEYTSDSDPYGDNSMNLQLHLPCEKMHMQMVYPSDYTATVKDLNAEKSLDLKKSTLVDEDVRVMEYTATNVPGLKDEPFAPYFRDMAPYFKVMFAHRSWQKATWTNIAKYYGDWTGASKRRRSSKVDEFVSDLVAKCKSKREKMDSIVTWVQNNITVGRGSKILYYQDFGDVLDSKTGIPPLIVGLTQSMLESVGISSDFVLLRDARDGYFDDSYVSIYQFGYPALRVRVDTSEYIVFPLNKSIPTSYVPEHLQGQKAMLIGEDGYYKFITIRAQNIGKLIVQENYNLSIDEDGKITVKESKTYSGSAGYAFRSAFKDLKKDELDKEVRKMLTYTEGDVKVKNYTISDLKDSRSPLTIDLEYTINNLVTVTPDEAIFQTSGLFAPSSEEKERFETEERQNPIEIDFDNSFVKDITITFPSKWKLTSSLSDVKDENNFGSVSRTYTQGEGTLKIHQERLLKRSSEPKEKIGDLVRLVGKKSKLQVPTLIFKTQ